MSDRHEFDDGYTFPITHRTLEEFIATDFPENLECYAPLLDWFVMEAPGAIGVQSSAEAELVTVTLREVDYHIGWNTTGPGVESTATLVAGSSLPPDVLESTVRSVLPRPLPDGLDLDVLDTETEGSFAWLVCRFDDEQIEDSPFVATGMQRLVDTAEEFQRRWLAD